MHLEKVWRAMGPPPQHDIPFEESTERPVVPWEIVRLLMRLPPGLEALE
jgi:hypothetical protein